MEKIILKRVGRNYFGYTAYKDEKGNFYLDLSSTLESNPKTLYGACPANDMDGEAGFELESDFVIVNPYTEREIREYHYKDLYMMLSKIYNDFTAYIGKTGEEEKDSRDFRYHNEKYGLWGNSVEETFEEIKRIWDLIPKDLKPQWCTAEDIAELERKVKIPN